MNSAQKSRRRTLRALAAAFAVSSLAAAFVFEQMKNRRPRPANNALSLDETGRAVSHRPVAAPGEPINVSGSNDEASSARDGRGFPVPRNETSAAGSGYTNEELHTLLEKEKARMGIKEILLKGQAAGDRNASETPHLSKDELAQRQETARQWMEQMREQLGRTLEAKESPSVELRGAKPALLAAPAATQAPGTPEETRPSRAAQPPSSASIAQESPRPLSLSEQPKFAATRKNRPLEPGGYILRSSQELETLWNRAEINAPIPVVDFDRDMLILVCAGGGLGVKIGETQTSGEKLLVKYREIQKVAVKTADENSPVSSAPLSPYQYRIIPRTDLPVDFQKLP